MATLTLTGAHGTSVANARRIKINGFNPSTGSGAIRGTAVYFWAYVSYVELGKTLALAWCQKDNKLGDCASVLCDITCNEINYFDFEDISVREGFLKYVDRLRKGNQKLTEEEMCQLYDSYYKFLESSNNTRCDVIRIKIWFDSGVYSRQVFGNNPDCYVVRALDSIRVQSILDEEGNEL